MLSKPERDALVARYTEYAHSLTSDICRDLPRFVSREDLRAVGIEGLVAAASRFDPTRGVQFSTFAYYRVRGAVFDQIRKLTANDPYLRARAAATAAVDEVVEGALAGRARSAGDGPAEAAEALSNVLDAAAAAFSVADCAEALLSSTVRKDTEEGAALLEAAGAVRAAVDTLPDRERAMVRSVYFEGATIEEAGAAMGLSKSWASRLHARALSLLRERVSDFQEE